MLPCQFEGPVWLFLALEPVPPRIRPDQFTNWAGNIRMHCQHVPPTKSVLPTKRCCQHVPLLARVGGTSLTLALLWRCLIWSCWPLACVAGAFLARIAPASPYLMMSAVSLCCRRFSRSCIALASPYLVMLMVNTCCRRFSHSCIASASPYVVMQTVDAYCRRCWLSHCSAVALSGNFNRRHVLSVLSLSHRSGLALFGDVHHWHVLPVLLSLLYCSGVTLFGHVNRWHKLPVFLSLSHCSGVTLFGSIVSPVAGAFLALAVLERRLVWWCRHVKDDSVLLVLGLCFPFFGQTFV